MLRNLATATLAAALTAGAQAGYNLQITEIWMGNEPGSNLTEDWFEITNLGNSAWTAAVDGDLYFEDSSADAGDAVLMSGIASIGAGESVIFVDEDDIAGFLSVWTGVSAAIVGGYDGSGLGQGGDAVAIWIGDPNVTLASPVDVEAYPDADLFGGQSWDVVLGAFSTVGNASGAYSTAPTVNDEGQPAIASPGTVVPAPAGFVGGQALTGLTLGRRRR